MKTAIRLEAQDVEAALTRLGLTSEPFIEAGKAGYLARAACTGNDAPFFPALAQWNRMVRALREHLRVEGWSKSDEGNYCLLVSPDGKMAIAVSSGCENTGNAVLMPTTKCPKGPSTVDAVVSNAAQLFLEGFEPSMQAVNEDDRVTWILLFHTADNELRLELSLPASMGDDGRPNAWLERIIFPAIPLDPTVSTPAPDFGPDFEVNVMRRPAGA